MKKAPARPEIFRYHDFLAFLKDWIEYRKATHPGFTVRSLSQQADLAGGYLSMVLSQKRRLSGKALAKVLPHLGLQKNEQSFLESLFSFNSSESQETRLAMLDRMATFDTYRKLNQQESETHRYLTHWYYVAIRELACLPDFKLDELWIQKQLCVDLPLREIREALEFLTSHGYLKKRPDGSVEPPEKPIHCFKEIYKLVFAKFHKEIFELATRSIDTTPANRRNIQGFTFPLKLKNYEATLAILEEALTKLRKLGEKETKGDSVYHVEIALFPITRGRDL